MNMKLSQLELLSKVSTFDDTIYIIHFMMADINIYITRAKQTSSLGNVVLVCSLLS